MLLLLLLLLLLLSLLLLLLWTSGHASDRRAELFDLLFDKTKVLVAGRRSHEGVFLELPGYSSTSLWIVVNSLHLTQSIGKKLDHFFTFGHGIHQMPGAHALLGLLHVVHGSKISDTMSIVVAISAVESRRCGGVFGWRCGEVGSTVRIDSD